MTKHGHSKNKIKDIEKGNIEIKKNSERKELNYKSPINKKRINKSENDISKSNF